MLPNIARIRGLARNAPNAICQIKFRRVRFAQTWLEEKGSSGTAKYMFTESISISSHSGTISKKNLDDLVLLDRNSKYSKLSVKTLVDRPASMRNLPLAQISC
jgi:hypothetical protein